MVEMVFVQSSNIDAVGYDETAGELHVRFKSSMATYVYQGVPPDVHARMMLSPSKGQFHSLEIKNVYSFYRL